MTSQIVDHYVNVILILYLNHLYKSDLMINVNNNIDAVESPFSLFLLVCT